MGWLRYYVYARNEKVRCMQSNHAPIGALRFRRAVLGSIVAGLLVLGACGDIRDETVDVSLNWTFTPTVRLGSASGRDALYRVDEYGITQGPDGTFVVLDEGNYRVLTFDGSGTLVGEFGSQGESAEAFGYPVAILGPRNDTIRVLDGRSSSYKIFNSQGEFLGQERVDEIFGLRSQQRLVGDGIVVVREVGYRSDGPTVSDHLMLVRSAGDTLPLATLAKPAWAVFSVPECQIISIPIPPVFESALVWDAMGDVVAVNDGPEYVVQVFEGGVENRRLERPILADEVNREIALRKIGPGSGVGVGDRRCRFDPEEELETRGFEERRQVVSDLRVDGDGWIWARRHAASLSEPDRLVVDVFDSDGVYRGTLPEASPWPATFTADGRMVALEVDDLGIQSYVVYSIDRGE